MEPNEMQRKMLKERQLKLLEEFIAFCEMHGMEYWMIGGSLLGAVRHRGMIPWDDDIDVCMPRKDYDRLVGCADQLGENRFLQCFETEPESGMLFAKLMDTGTVYVETSRRKMNIHHCVFIDIFPLDDYPQGLISRTLRTLRDLFVKLRLRCLYTPASERQPLRSMAVRHLCELSKLLHSDVTEMCLRHRAYLRQPCRSEYMYLFAGAYGRKDVYRREWFAGTLTVRYEHLTVRIPAGYDALLKQVYGEYMKYPAECMRKGHHDAQEFRINA